MSSSGSSRSSSPVLNSALDDFDYIRALEKHSNLDAILPPEGTRQSASSVPTFPGNEVQDFAPFPSDVSSKHPGIHRTFSELEESRSTPRSGRPSIVSALMNLGARPRSRSFARQLSHSQGSNASPSVGRLVGPSPFSFLNDGNINDLKHDKKQLREEFSSEARRIVNHVEGFIAPQVDHLCMFIISF
jgi:hypothetical protein